MSGITNERIGNRIIRLGRCCRCDLDEVADELSQIKQQLADRDARIAWLEARLEIDHAFNTDGERIDIAPSDRDKFPDGITCRDATIELQDKAIDKLKARIARLEDLLRSRKLTVEASLAAEILADNSVKCAIERAALVEIDLIQHALIQREEEEA